MTDFALAGVSKCVPSGSCGPRAEGCGQRRAGPLRSSLPRGQLNTFHKSSKKNSFYTYILAKYIWNILGHLSMTLESPYESSSPDLGNLYLYRNIDYSVPRMQVSPSITVLDTARQCFTTVTVLSSMITHMLPYTHIKC